MSFSQHPAFPVLPAQQLQGMRRGIEKESLRVTPQGELARTPHPLALGSALTHPHITTDFCESQLELVTAAHPSIAQTLGELSELHAVVARAISPERLWVASMPCPLPADEEQIPLGQYGSSHIGQAKTVYRRGLGHRYGRRMQTISGIHYNWSMPGVGDDGYFALIRNFRRHAFLLLYLFGASPAVDAGFVAGLDHGLTPLGEGSFHLPWATSLRMGRLGYQSDAQSRLCVSYNSLESYGAALEVGLTQEHPPYAAIGLQDAAGQYQQLGTTLLQIENEFYGTIRPKQPIRRGERPLHALRERGVAYVEVRCMDLDPFCPIGIQASTAHFLEVFLLHCLLSPSAPDSPAENAALARNQHLTAARGREPGLMLERDGQPVALTAWAEELLSQMQPLARQLDEALAEASGQNHQPDQADPQRQPHLHALAQAQAALADPSRLPSARVLAAVQQAAQAGDKAFVQATRSQSADTAQALLTLPLSPERAAHHQALAEQSVQEQARLEEESSGSFGEFLAQYLASDGLRVAA